MMAFRSLSRSFQKNFYIADKACNPVWSKCMSSKTLWNKDKKIGKALLKGKKIPKGSPKTRAKKLGHEIISPFLEENGKVIRRGKSVTLSEEDLIRLEPELEFTDNQDLYSEKDDEILTSIHEDDSHTANKSNESEEDLDGRVSSIHEDDTHTANKSNESEEDLDDRVSSIPEDGSHTANESNQSEEDLDDWYGFDGDLDKIDNKGVPTWISALRTLSETHQSALNDDKVAKKLKPVIERFPKIDQHGQAYGRGGRKASRAQVWISKSTTGGQFSVNKMHLAEYFVRDTHKEEALSPFMVLDNLGDFDVNCFVRGGGFTGQAGAIRLGLSRALQHYNPEFRSALKSEGFLKRDARVVERKKPGQPKARKKFQWVKR